MHVPYQSPPSSHSSPPSPTTHSRLRPSHLATTPDKNLTPRRRSFHPHSLGRRFNITSPRIGEHNPLLPTRATKKLMKMTSRLPTGKPRSHSRRRTHSHSPRTRSSLSSLPIHTIPSIHPPPILDLHSTTAPTTPLSGGTDGKDGRRQKD